MLVRPTLLPPCTVIYVTILFGSWANATLSQDCVVDNTAYTGYRADGTQFATIISRDNCIAPSLWCNSQTNKCEGARNVGEACQADKMCLSVSGHSATS